VKFPLKTAVDGGHFSYLQCRINITEMIIEKKMERTVSRTKKLTVIKQSLQNWRLKLAGALADHNRNVLT